MSMSLRNSVATLVLAVIAAASVAAMPGGGCHVTCIGEECRLTEPPAKGQPGTAQSRFVTACKTRALECGKAALLFLYSTRVTEARVDSAASCAAKSSDKRGKAFDDVLKAYNAIDCGPGDPNGNCPPRGAPQRPAGKPFGAASSWQPVGDPCGLALPCGKIGLTSDGLRIQMDPARVGKLRVVTASGASREETVPVVDGVAAVSNDVLRAGETFYYDYLDAGGVVVAAGTFTVLSQRAQQDSDRALAEALRQPADARAKAVIESLLADGRAWEALLWSTGASR